MATSPSTTCTKQRRSSVVQDRQCNVGWLCAARVVAGAAALRQQACGHGGRIPYRYMKIIFLKRENASCEIDGLRDGASLLT